MTGSTPAGKAAAVIICEPDPACVDPHIYRWYCERDPETKLCPLKKCRAESAGAVS